MGGSVETRSDSEDLDEAEGFEKRLGEEIGEGVEGVGELPVAHSRFGALTA